MHCYFGFFLDVGIVLRSILTGKTVVLAFLAGFLALSVSGFAQTGEKEDLNELLAGRWSLVNVEVVQAINNRDIGSQTYTPSNIARSNHIRKIYFEKINFLRNGEVIYGGIGDRALLEQAGKFHIQDNNVITFQNPKIGFMFTFSWEKPHTLFVLEERIHVSQQNNESAKIRFYYQKDE